MTLRLLKMTMMRVATSSCDVAGVRSNCEGMGEENGRMFQNLRKIEETARQGNKDLS